MKNLNTYQSLIVLATLTLALPLARAATAGDGTMPRRTQLAVELPGNDSCLVVLGGTGRPSALALPFAAPQGTLADNVLNGPREITLKEYSPVPSKNREAQLEAARALAEKIAERLLTPEVLGSESGLIEVQDVLTNTLGRLPDGSLQSIQSILEADLGSLRDPNRQPDVQKQTQNALAELTRTVTQYRESGFDVNSVANGLNRLSRIPLLGRFFDNTGDLLRERFQSVKSAISAIDGTLQQSVGHMRVRHEQMREARLELKTLERYLEISAMVAQELQKVVTEYRDSHSELTADARALFEKNILLPVVTRIQMIQRQQATVVTAYHQFRLLMDGNLDLIMIISNIRQTAQLELTVFAAGRIIANEQARTTDLARTTLGALDDVRHQSVEQIKQNGIRIREFSDTMIKSTADMMKTIDDLLAELEVARQNLPITIAKIDASNRELEPRLARAIESMKDGQVIDMVRVADEVGTTYQRHESLDLPQVPAVVKP